MDESAIWLSQLLKQVKELKLQRNESDLEFEQMMLYVLGAHLIDWNTDSRFGPIQQNSILSPADYRRLVQLLLDYCDRPDAGLTFNLDRVEVLSRLVEDWAERRAQGERLALFDALFYRIIGRAGFNRRHADFIAELTTGLSRNFGINDLYASNGETLVRHLDRYAMNARYEVGDTGEALQHLTFLRLAVHSIAFEITRAPMKSNSENLTLLDHPELLSKPFTRLFELFKNGEFVGQALIVFQLNIGAEDSNQKKIRRLLSDQDLLEAIFDFTSYNPAGKPRRYNAWLLNSKKRHVQKTLCIDTRQSLEAIKGASAQHVAAFGASIVHAWRSSADEDVFDELIQPLGPLKGLFAQWFDKGYRDIAGVCKVIDTQQALKMAVSTKKVPEGNEKLSFTLLDRRPIELLLDDSPQGAFCIYVIGNNGAGKSFLLASMISSLKQREISCAAIAIGAKDRFPNWRKNLGSYRYLGDRTNKGYSLRAVEAKLIGHLAEASREPSRMLQFDHVMELLGFKHQFYLLPKGAIDDESAPFEMSDLLKPLAQQFKELESTQEIFLYVVVQDSTKLLRFSELSSGEQQVLCLFAKIIVAAGPGRVLLIDEPEISLHVHWQQILPRLFRLIAHTLNTRLIIATHSPTLIANAQENFDHCYLAKNQQLTEIPPERRHSVETILLEGFEIYTPHNREIPERCAALVADAVRATNMSKRPDFSLQKQLEEKLSELRTLMESSGSLLDKRFMRDQQLISQASRAIDETFHLANGRRGS